MIISILSFEYQDHDFFFINISKMIGILENFKIYLLEFSEILSSSFSFFLIIIILRIIDLIIDLFIFINIVNMIFDIILILDILIYHYRKIIYASNYRLSYHFSFFSISNIYSYIQSIFLNIFNINIMIILLFHNFFFFNSK